MADYENTVGIQLNEDFKKATDSLRQLIGVMRQAKEMMTTLSTTTKEMSRSLNSLNTSKISKMSQQLQALTSALRGLSSTSMAGVIGKTDDLKTFLETLNSMKVSSLYQLNQIPKTMQSIAAVDTKNIGAVFSTLATQIQPFIAKLKEASDEIKALASVTKEINKFNQNMQNAQKEVDKLGNRADNTKRKLNSMFTMGNLIYWYNMSKRVFDFINRSIQSAIDFREIENKFTAAMGNMRTQALKFAYEVNESFGLALADVMDSQATFKNMLSAIDGLAGETATWLSGVLMEMSVDFSSLYNTSIKDAITKMESALSRQVRPIRSTSGMDITQNVLGASLQQLGIYDRTVAQLSEMEKRLLIVYTLQQQMGNSNALGDYARTIEATANQLRVLEQQIKEVGMWLGAVFEGTLGRILPYLNATVMVVKELVKAFAMLVGYEMPDSSSNILDMMDDTAEDFGTTLNGGIDKAAEKIKNMLAPFDKVNVLSKPTDNSGGSGSGIAGIDPRILEALSQYESSLSNVSMRATKIRDTIMEWLGFTKQVNEQTGEITWVFSDGYTNLKKIRDVILAIVGYKILSGTGALSYLYNFFLAIKNWGIVSALRGLSATLSTIITPMHAVIAAISAITAAIIQLWNSNDEWKSKAVRAWENIKTVIQNVYQNVLKPVFDGISVALGMIYEWGIQPLWDSWVEFVRAVSELMLDLWNDILSPLVNWFLQTFGPVLKATFESFGAVVGSVVGDVLTLISRILDAFTTFVNDLRGKINGLTSFFTKVFTADWKSVFNSLGTIINDWFNNKVKPFFTEGKWLTMLNGITKAFKTIFKNSTNVAAGVINQLITWVNNKFKLSWKDLSILGQTIIKAGSFSVLNIPKIPTFWHGGIVPNNVGQLFIANEPGNPELVGNIGGHTGVVNNNMIIEAIKGAMKTAIVEGMQLVYSQAPNGDTYVDVYIDGVFTERKLVKTNDKHILKTGKAVFSY